MVRKFGVLFRFEHVEIANAFHNLGATDLEQHMIHDIRCRMESILSRSPTNEPRNNRERGLGSTIGAPPATPQGRLVTMAYVGEVITNAGGVREETRDDPQAPTRRWVSANSRKPPVGARPQVPPERSFRDSTNGQHGYDDPRYAERRQHVPGRSWHHHADHWYRGRDRMPHHVHHYAAYDHRQPPQSGGMVPVSASEEAARARQHQQRMTSYGSAGSSSTYTTGVSSSVQWSRGQHHRNSNSMAQRIGSSHTGRASREPPSSRVVIPRNIVIPKELAPHMSETDESSPTEQSLGKRSSDSSDVASPPTTTRSVKRTRFHRGQVVEAKLEGRFDKLDLLCSATLELGPLQDNPTGCSCPKSKCVALYCDCFKAGRRCDPSICTCLNCKNTVGESGPNGARVKAIQAILTRNPRAFTNAGTTPVANKLPPGEQACNCIRSRCLKLYCTCFQTGKTCKPGMCTCVGCLNTHEDDGGQRKAAIQTTLEKRPDAFGKPKVKEIGSGCACKNNKCIRKYCECFRTKLSCTQKCSCRDCENQEVVPIRST